jgi:hypothetical protein
MERNLYLQKKCFYLQENARYDRKQFQEVYGNPPDYDKNSQAACEPVLYLYGYDILTFIPNF